MTNKHGIDKKCTFESCWLIVVFGESTEKSMIIYTTAQLKEARIKNKTLAYANTGE